MIGTGFFLFAHVCYIVAFNLGQEVRNISRGYVWARRAGVGLVLAMFVGNTVALFGVFPNQVLFPVYGFALVLMTASAMKRY